MLLSELIAKILNAKHLGQVIKIDNYKAEYKNIMKQLHPDRCKLPNATEAVAKLSGWVAEFEKGSVFTDELGESRFTGYSVKITATDKNSDILHKWVDGYNKIHLANNSHLNKYIPTRISTPADALEYDFLNRSIRIPGLLVLDQVHVNWILSRLLEFCMMMESAGLVHGNLTPDSVFISPDEHGVVISGFHHLSKSGSKMTTISGKFKNWYPTSLFRDKIATSNIDLEMAKKLAIYLLGDVSGSGTKFRLTHNSDLINFYLTSHNSAKDAYKEYRDILKRNFESKFHLLNL